MKFYQFCFREVVKVHSSSKQIHCVLKKFVNEKPVVLAFVFSLVLCTDHFEKARLLGYASRSVGNRWALLAFKKFSNFTIVLGEKHVLRPTVILEKYIRFAFKFLWCALPHGENMLIS